MLKNMGERTPPCGTPDLNWRFVCHASFDVVCDVSEYGVWYVSVCEFIIIIIFISYYNGTRFTKEIQLYIYLQKIFIIA